MAKNNQDQAPQRTYGPQSDEESAAFAYGNANPRSRDAADYVNVTTYQGDDGVRTEQQVLRSDLEGDYDEETGPLTFDKDDETFKGVSLDDDHVREAHPAQNRPASALTEEEQKEQGRGPAAREEQNNS